MLLLAIALSILVLVTGRAEPATGLAIVPDGPYTFAEREASMFPDGPHWIVRGFRQQDLISLSILLLLITFSGSCTAMALRALVTKHGLSHMPLVAGASILPVWVGVCLTFAMLRLLPHYAGQPSYHHDWLGAIRVTLLTSLLAGLIPATLAVAALLRHSVSNASPNATGNT